MAAASTKDSSGLLNGSFIGSIDHLNANNSSLVDGMNIINSPGTSSFSHNISIDRDNVEHIFSTRDFSLNIDRALKRKINACKEVRVEYDYTAGGITGSMDTATFELFRIA